MVFSFFLILYYYSLLLYFKHSCLKKFTHKSLMERKVYACHVTLLCILLTCHNEYANFIGDMEILFGYMEILMQTRKILLETYKL
jgi:hypothetical protein